MFIYNNFRMDGEGSCQSGSCNSSDDAQAPAPETTEGGDSSGEEKAPGSCQSGSCQSA